MPFTAWVPIQGYRIEGSVISSDGVPVTNVAVKVLYYYRKVSYSPMDTARIFIADTTKSMQVTVVTPTLTHVKFLYSGYPSAGVFPRQIWNELTDSGESVPSGKYLIRYSYGGSVVKVTPYIVENTVTTWTDAEGAFVLDNTALPIEERFDIYDQAAPHSFIGAYEIRPLVRLVFIKYGDTMWQEFEVQKNKLTRRVFTFQ